VLVGSGQLIKGFDTALVGMTEGEVKTVNLLLMKHMVLDEEAWSPHPRNAFPEDFPFEEGMPVARAGPKRKPSPRKDCFIY
jgi:FKBP-type peptidyl-prolyl cis-trans isomerase 2